MTKLRALVFLVTLAGTAGAASPQPPGLRAALQKNAYFQTMTALPFQSFRQRDVDLRVRLLGCKEVFESELQTDAPGSLDSFIFMHWALVELLATTGEGTFMVKDREWNALDGHEKDFILKTLRAWEGKPSQASFLFERPTGHLFVLPFELNRLIHFSRLKDRKKVNEVLDNLRRNYSPSSLEALVVPSERAMRENYDRAGVAYTGELRVDCGKLKARVRTAINYCKERFPDLDTSGIDYQSDDEKPITPLIQQP